MNCTSIPARLGVLTFGVVAAALMAAAPAMADPSTDPSVDSPGPAGPGMDDPTRDAAFGEALCPMLAQPGQDMADAGGMGIGPGSAFTGMAISAFCPGALSALSNGESPIPLGLLGGLGS